MAITEFLSPCSITIGSESFLNFEKLLQSLHIWCDTLASMHHCRAAAAAWVGAVSADAVDQKKSWSPVVATADVAVAFFTFHHSFTRLWETLWWENGSHHYRATHLSGYVTGLGLSRLCITPSTRLKNLRWTASDTTIQTDLTNHYLISFLLLSFVS